MKNFNKYLSFCLTYGILLINGLRADSETLQGAYGLGEHASYDERGPLQQPISRLTKDSAVYELRRTGDESIEIVHYPVSTNGAPVPVSDVINFNTRLGPFRNTIEDVRLVDVWVELGQMSFVLAGHNGYTYFKVSSNSFPGAFVVPAGHVEIAPAGVNTGSWKMSHKIFGGTSFGYSFAGWSHYTAIDAIRLASLTSIEIDTTPVSGGSTQTDTYSIIGNTIEKEGVGVSGIKLYNPSTCSEADLIGRYSLTDAPDDDAVNEEVAWGEGGKTHLYTVLDSLADQVAAAAIKVRVEAAEGS